MNTNDITEVVGEAPSAEDTFWLEAARGAAKESIGSLEGAAKQLIALAGFLQGLYFAAISFSDFKSALVVRDYISLVAVTGFAELLAIPMLLWLVSLFFAVRVFKPETYRTNLGSPDLAREFYQEVAAFKHRNLRWAYAFFWPSFIFVLINVLIYLIFVPPPP